MGYGNDKGGAVRRVSEAFSPHCGTMHGKRSNASAAQGHTRWLSGLHISKLLDQLDLERLACLTEI